MSINNLPLAVVMALLLVAFCAVIASGEKLLFKPFSSDREIEQKDDSRIQANAFTNALTIMCPGKKSQCQEGQTCCELLDGGYGCCPLQKAVCCEDKLHCCPMNTVCQIEEGLCLHKSGLQSNWHAKQPAKMLIGSTVCPDGVAICDDDQTCCLSLTGFYGCCPLFHAVCCSDGKHCCPEGTTCDATSETCLNSNGASHSWSVIVESKEKQKKAELIVPNDFCPDGHSYCKSGETCCMLLTGKWGCCPLLNAVCCPDQQHCCPSGSSCDTTTSTCVHKNGLLTNWHATISSMQKEELTRQYCPDGKTYCQDGQTCCWMSTNEYGCCPLLHAVCCSDGKHCCPEGTTCDVTSETCLKRSGTSDSWSVIVDSKEKQKKAELELTNHHCPDGKSYCKDAETCCLMSTGKYGCCPLPQAVCCPDRSHCCPYGSKCDTVTKTCKHYNGLTTDWVLKVPAKQKPNIALHDKLCPDQKSYCLDLQTCCIFPSGEYGCCPMPQAICCPDMEHCCPNGTVCNTEKSTCDKPGSTSVSRFKKLLANGVKRNPKKVVCPDQISYCPDRQTCCIMDSGEYGCCPYEDAVCCTDRLHCCPEGYNCDASGGSCRKGSLTVPWMEKLSPTPRPAVHGLGKIVCPDEISYCSDRQTCCLMESGEYGCCPYQDAVCCSDELHCCPKGFKCNDVTATCTKESLAIPWLEKLPSTPMPLIRKGVQQTCPDGSSCSNLQTCCPIASGGYGCCLFPNADCCSDRIHCCPSGFNCDSSGSCRLGSVTVPWFKKLPSIPPAVTDLNVKKDVLCPNKTRFCKEGYPCCMLYDGQESCCVYENGVCCEDHIHCCGHGEVCDVAHHRCLSKIEEETIPMVKQEVIVECDERYYCMEKETCCPQKDGAYKCCPTPNASCCKDGIHCCEFWCVPWFNKCLIKSDLKKVNPFIRLSEIEGHVPLTAKQAQKVNWCDRAESLACPDGYECDLSRKLCIKHRLQITEITAKPLPSLCPIRSKQQTIKHCKDKEMCCSYGEDSKLSRCCPFSDGVCCDDGLHCCPANSTCDPKTNMCKSVGAELWIGMTSFTNLPPRVVDLSKGERIPSLLQSSSLLGKDVSCEDNTTCADDTTCCLQNNGQYTCCQYKNAVCCKDKLHCCPQGYKCDLEGHTCTFASEALPGSLQVDVPMVSLDARAPSPSKGSDVRCTRPDVGVVTHLCPSGHACCFSDGGDNNIPVCCQNNTSTCCNGFCCPTGYTCGKEKRECLKDGSPMAALLP